LLELNFPAGLSDVPAVNQFLDSDGVLPKNRIRNRKRISNRQLCEYRTLLPPNKKGVISSRWRLAQLSILVLESDEIFII